MAETTDQYRTRINQLNASIKNEPYIEKMRSDIAEGVSKTGNRQADLENDHEAFKSDLGGQFKNVIDETTGKDFTSAPEIIAARKSKPNLNARLEDFEQSTTAQFQQITQDSSLTVAVGSGGDYPTINKALEFLSRKTLNYSLTGLKVEILLKTGFVMKEQIYVKNIDLGFITISSEDVEVSVDASGFTDNVNETGYGNSGYPLTSGAAFTGYGNAILPTINVLFNFNSIGLIGLTHGVFLIYGAVGRIERKKGFKGGLATGATIVEGSRLYATEAILKDNNSNNISCFRGSYVLFRAGIATGSKNGYGIYLDNACMGDLISSDFSNSKLGGIWASGLSLASANRVVVNNSGGSGLIADTGSTIDAHLSTVIGSAQRGVSCDGSVVNVNDSKITDSGLLNVFATKNGNVNADNAVLTGSKGTNSVYANYGGTINISKSDCRMKPGIDGSDIRVGYGGIIYAHGAIGGFSGAFPNVLSKNGLIFNDDPVNDNTTFGDIKTLSPLGSWTGTLSYSKMPNGLVWLRGTLTAGTELTKGFKIGTIETGYRPPFPSASPVLQSNNSSVYHVHMTPSGSLSLSDDLVVGSYHFNILYKS